MGQVRDSLGSHGLDALLVSKAANLRWLTGFTGSWGQLLVTPSDLLLVTDGRYGEQAAAELAEAGVEGELVISTALADIFRSRVQDGRVGLEANAVTWAAARQAQTEWFPSAQVEPVIDLVESHRAIKDRGEVARIESAAAVADAALAEIVAEIRPGITERAVATALESAMVALGADGPAFETIVAAGPNGARPHHRPGDRALANGDLVVIDMGAMVDGYCSDMTRTFGIGSLGPVETRMLEVTIAAQAAGVDAVTDGVPARDVDAAARSVISEAGWADNFVHPTGHGLGLEIHEPLRVAATSDATLTAGHVVTVEPGVYLPGIGGVRIEDTVEVTAEGARTLTRSSLPVAIG